MNWFIWEQHKKWFLIVGVCFVLFAAILIPTGLHFWNSYQQALAACHQTPTCSQANPIQSSTDQLLVNDLVPDAMLFLPILFGLFWGVPLIAKEYVEGTDLLIWTRSVSRRKWLTLKLVWIMTATVIFVGAFAALTTWWSKTPNALNSSRFDVSSFSTQGIAPIAYSIFAVAVGAMLGAWFRRLMIALGVTLALLIAIILVGVPNFVRPHYMAPATVTASMAQNALDSKLPSGAWELSHYVEGKNGQIFSRLEFPDYPPKCQTLVQEQATLVEGAQPGQGTINSVNSCLTNAGFHQVGTFQPSYRYWKFQWIESGLYLGMAAVAVGATYWLVLKRDA